MGFNGDKFTWWNRSCQDSAIREKLDRGLLSSKLREEYPWANVTYLEDTGSNHRPLLMCTNQTTHKGKRRFRFQERWCGMAEVDKIVSETLLTSFPGSSMYQLFQKLKKCRHELVKWQSAGTSNSKKKIDELKALLSVAKADPTIADKKQILLLEDELAAAHISEERYWKEKSRVSWLKWGDQNTKFFHAKNQSRNRRNKIWKLEDEEGNWCTTPEAIGNRAQRFFVDLFESNNPEDPSQFFTKLRVKVSSEMNRSLTKPVSDDEIKRAAFSINAEAAQETTDSPQNFISSIGAGLEGMYARL
ncbi:uncharacterized protein [Arachis hypogaea]|uniref:uncharacterized protein n=1 Tax=Arachis hypogaea TaxID=3818 RepID=UPI003B223501